MAPAKKTSRALGAGIRQQALSLENLPGSPAPTDSSVEDMRAKHTGPQDSQGGGQADGKLQQLMEDMVDTVSKPEKQGT